MKESLLASWWAREAAKRSMQLDNEIDRNEIFQALRGTRNKWFDKVQKNPDLFKDLVDGKNKDWDSIYD